MDLKRTVVGAVAGAALGLGLHLAVGVIAKTEAVWFSIITGVCVGLGVWLAHKGIPRNVSYLRGAITAAVALAAILSSVYLVRIAIAKAQTRLDVSQRPPLQEGEVRDPATPPAAAEKAPDKPSDTNEEPTETTSDGAEKPAETSSEAAGESDGVEPASDEDAGHVADDTAEKTEAPAAVTKVEPSASTPQSVNFELREANVWDFICIALGVFLAYELARGHSNRPHVPSSEPLKDGM